MCGFRGEGSECSLFATAISRISPLLMSERGSSGGTPSPPPPAQAHLLSLHLLVMFPPHHVPPGPLCPSCLTQCFVRPPPPPGFILGPCPHPVSLSSPQPPPPQPPPLPIVSLQFWTVTPQVLSSLLSHVTLLVTTPLVTQVALGLPVRAPSLFRGGGPALGSAQVQGLQLHMPPPPAPPLPAPQTCLILLTISIFPICSP